MIKPHLDFYLSTAHSHSRQLWHYTERVPCDLERIMGDASGEKPTIVFNLRHPSGAIMSLPWESAEIVPQSGDEALLVPREYEKYWIATNNSPMPRMPWEKRLRIWSVENGMAKTVGALVIVAPLRCFSFLQSTNQGLTLIA